jgi:putative Mg2+ transporter-C (MgtC) family protein
MRELPVKTTAATLWYVTVVGLCIGGGQLAVGAIGLTLGLIVLWGAKWIEMRLPRAQSAQLVVAYAKDSPFRRSLVDMLQRDGCRLVSVAFSTEADSAVCEETCEVHWHAHNSAEVTPLLRESSLMDGADLVRWSTVR